jgi:ABC-2 type transport system ATP-binding protein
VHAIEATGLTKSFRGVLAVDGVDLLVEEGDVVALLGPNGAGKTTTLMMLLGITQPDFGSVRLLGRELPRDRARAMERLGFTASYVAIPGDMRVWQFLDVFAGLYGVPRRRGEEALDALGLGTLLSRTGNQLSSGQRTLVGIAKALMNRPRLLVMDEPTASLDPEVAARVRDVLLEEQRREGFAVLVTSHNMAEIERLCRRVVFLAGGRIVDDGPPDEIAARHGTADLESTFISIASEARR